MGLIITSVRSQRKTRPISHYLKGNVQNKKVLAFEQGADGVFRYQGRLCVPMVDGIQERIIEEDHRSKYSIHPGSTKRYHDLREV